MWSWFCENISKHPRMQELFSKHSCAQWRYHQSRNYHISSAISHLCKLWTWAGKQGQIAGLLRLLHTRLNKWPETPTRHLWGHTVLWYTSKGCCPLVMCLGVFFFFVCYCLNIMWPEEKLWYDNCFSPADKENIFSIMLENAWGLSISFFPVSENILLELKWKGKGCIRHHISII